MASWGLGGVESLGVGCFRFEIYGMGVVDTGSCALMRNMEFARVLHVMGFMGGRDAPHGSSCHGEGTCPATGISASPTPAFSNVFQWGYMKPAAVFDGCE